MKSAIFFVGAACSILSACGKSPDISFRFDAALPAADVAIAENGASALVKACSGISRYWGDLSLVEPAKVGEASLSSQRDYGWQRSAEITLEVSGNPESIPAEYHANGHRCYFEIGAGQSGVSVTKRPCIAICRGAPANTSYILVKPQ